MSLSNFQSMPPKKSKTPPERASTPVEAEVKMINAPQVKDENAKSLATQYMRKDVVSDFSKLAPHLKLSIFQKTPPDFIKTRRIGKTDIPYIDHQFAEKALNFVFNFLVSNEVISHEIGEYEADVTRWENGQPRKEKAKIIEAECMVKFTFKTPEGETIIRTVYSSHKGYQNPATTRGDVLKSAISKSWTVVARTFGIGGDLKDREEKAYESAQEAEPVKEQPVAKSFASGPSY